MKNNARRILSATLLTLLGLLAGAGFVHLANAKGSELEERLTEIKESTAKNKQELASYSWNEQVTISLKGEEKKQEHFQVRLGPDLTPQKTSLDLPPEPPSGGRLKKHVIAKKKEEYKEYADQMKALAEQYVPPDGALLQQAYAQGGITVGPAGAPQVLQLVIHNYLKPHDSMTLIFDRTVKQLLQIQIASYMDDPKDAVNLTVEF